MKRIILVLTLLIGSTTVVNAHAGAHVAGRSIFDKTYKYRINTSESHIGHFYIKKARASRKGNERLRIEHTIHLESDVVKKFNVKYKESSSMLSYNYDMDGFTYFFNFHLLEDPLTSSNPGSMTIFNKTDKSFSVSNVTLDPLLEDGETEGHTDGSHGDASHDGDAGHSHG